MLATAPLEEQIRATSRELLAARIREARGGVPQDRFADSIGTSRRHLIRLEKGYNRPRAAMLTRIAEATQTPVETFLRPDPGSPFPPEISTTSSTSSSTHSRGPSDD